MKIMGGHHQPVEGADSPIRYEWPGPVDPARCDQPCRGVTHTSRCAGAAGHANDGETWHDCDPRFWSDRAT